MHGMTRLALLANAVQLTARKLLDHLTDCNSGLISDPWETVFAEHHNTQAKARTGVTVTNVMVQLPVDTDWPTFVLHNRHPSMISVFVPPQQDPMITHMMDLFGDYDDDGNNNNNNNNDHTTRRWIIASIYAIDAESTATTLTDDPIILAMLLRDLQQTLPGTAEYRVDSFLSASLPSRRDDSYNPVPDTAIQKWSRNETIGNLCRRHRDGLVMVGRPRTGHYAPAMSRLCWQTERGLVPWSIGRPDLFTWKCYSVVPVDHLRTIGLDQISCLAQHDGGVGWSMLTDRKQIVRFLAAGLSDGTSSPAVRVLDVPVGFMVRKVAAKRVFALQDGTLFCSRRPLKMSDKLLWMNARAGSYATDCNGGPIPMQRVNRHFARGSLMGSEIWFPLAADGGDDRCYENGVPREIAPIVQWLDTELRDAKAEMV